MESSFFQIPKGHADQLNPPLLTELDYSDKRIVQENIVSANQLKSIDLSHLSKPIKITDIIQAGIGNCYLLSCLDSILEHDPNFLNKLIVYKNNKFHVTLFDPANPDHAYVYILDPTKVIGEKTNQHSHDLIFILEKAFALHRIHLESRPLTSEEMKIRAAYQQNKEDLLQTRKALLKLRSQEIAVMREKVEEQMQALKKQLSNTNAIENITDPHQQLLLNFLHTHNGVINAAVNDYIKNQFSETYSIIDLKLAIANIKDARIDYVSALTQGETGNTFKTLLGNVPVEFIYIPEPYTPAQILLLLVQIKEANIENFSEEVNKFLTTVFKDHELEKDYFICSLKNTDAKFFWDALELLQTKKIKVDPQVFFTEFLKNTVDWLVDTNRRQASVEAFLEIFMKNTLVSKRGTGQYTQTELLLFELVNTALSEKKLVIFTTRKSVSTNPDNTKGLVPNHAYVVRNALKRGGLIFFELQNPWAEGVRQYTTKKKMIGNAEVMVLTAKGQKQLSPLLFDLSRDFLGLNSSPLTKKRTYVANPEAKEKLWGGGFYLELTDCHKRIVSIDICTTQYRKEITPAILP